MKVTLGGNHFVARILSYLPRSYLILKTGRKHCTKRQTPCDRLLAPLQTFTPTEEPRHGV